MYGGYFKKRNEIISNKEDEDSRNNSRMSNNFKTKLSNEDIKEFLDAVNNKTTIQNNYSNSELLYKHSPNGGGNVFDDDESNGKHKYTYNSKFNSKSKKTKKSSNTHTKDKSQKRSKTGRRKRGGYHGIGGAPETDAEKKAKRNQKIMELVSLKGLKPRQMMPSQSVQDNIMAALFYGFSNNIACFTGAGKKYNVKFSPIKGSISKSMFDYIGRTPDFVIYHEFTVTKTMGRPDEAKLNIVSEVRPNEFGQFLDLNEIKKQL